MYNEPPHTPNDPHREPAKPEGIFFTTEAGKKEARNPFHSLGHSVDALVHRPLAITLTIMTLCFVLITTLAITRPDVLRLLQTGAIWAVTLGQTDPVFEVPDAQTLEPNSISYSGLENTDSAGSDNGGASGSASGSANGGFGGGSSSNNSGDYPEDDDDEIIDDIDIGPKPTTPPPVVTPPTDTIKPVVSSAGFTHPGILVNLSQLNFTKQKLAQKAAPWHTIYLQAASSSQSIRTPNLSGMVLANDTSKKCSNTAAAGCVVQCGYKGGADDGCKDERIDASSAYTQALLWYYTGQESYAQSAVTILNTYARQLKDHTDKNRAVQLAWTSQTLLRAAELIRYTYTPSPGKQAFNIAQFTNMINTVFVPTLKGYNYANYNGNWDLSAIEGLINVAVFTDNRGLYNQALSKWRTRTPAYIYLASDGSSPKTMPNTRYGANAAEVGCYWIAYKAPACNSSPRGNPNMNYQNGQPQEACRDFPHTGMGLASMINTAETAYLQGTNLYGEQKQRIMAALAYTTQIAQNYAKTKTYPKGFCNDTKQGNAASSLLASEIAYNAYAVRGGTPFSPISIASLPGASFISNDPLLSYITQLRTTSNAASMISVWETLTHHRVGNGI
jgi:hypothetical protein